MQTPADRHVHARSAPGRTMLLLLSAAWLAGCGRQATVTSEWQDKVPRDQTFKRVLIVGVSPDLNQRCAFEYFMASQVKSDSTVAIASCDAVLKRDPLTRESIEGAVAAQQADAVLATTLVAKGLQAKEGGSSDTRGGGYYKATAIGYETTYTGTYGIPVVYGEFQTAQSIMTIKGMVRVETKLYETRGASLVYTMDTTAKNLDSREEGLAILTAPIAQRLRRDGLIR